MRARPVSGAAAALALLLLGATQGAVSADTSHAADGLVHRGGVSVYTNDVVAPPTSASRVAAPTRTAPAYPLADTFKLHSLKSSPRKIYLDFTSVTPTAGSWSEDLDMPLKAYTGFTLQGSATTFTTKEKEFIQEIFRRVAETYAPFHVDVTTEDPGQAALSRTHLDDQAYGVRVAITSDPTASALACGIGSKCSGLAPMGSFDMVEEVPGQFQPAWVFAANTYPEINRPNSAILTAASISHEVGHTFGLRHDGTTRSGYYGGHAHWFPIMGNNMGYTSLGQWSKGEYAGANNREDDLATINAGGAPYRTDDYPDANEKPVSLGVAHTVGSTAFVRGGVIGAGLDNDHFTFNRGCAGPMQVKAVGVGVAATVDLKLTVLSSAGEVLATNNPTSGQTHTSPDPWRRPTGLDAAVSFAHAPRGAYRVKVEGVGSGNPLSTGYSRYGSVGKYTLSVTRCTTKLAGVLRPSAPTIGAARSGSAGKPVNAVVRWSAPRSTGGAAISQYRVQAVKVDASGAMVQTYTVAKIKPSLRTVTLALPAGRYKFRVAATNKVGTSSYSSYSQIVTSR